MLPGRWNLANLRRLPHNPSFILGEFNRFGVLLDKQVLKVTGPRRTGSILSEDWDVLYLLDACRADYFEEVNWISGEFSTRVSAGSQSREFMRANFSGNHHDTVYITANPNASTIADETFHEMVRVFDEGWSDDTRTVPPGRVSDAALRAATEYPRKRLLIHFMQPHAPYIGRTTVPHQHATEPGEVDRTIWANLRYGIKDVTLSEVRRAYRDNLELVLREVDRFRNEIAGKAVISADHGELLGDRLRPVPVRGYGHPPGLRTPELVRVPWLEMEYERRRDIEATEPVERVDDVLDSDELDERLAALGYR